MKKNILSVIALGLLLVVADVMAVESTSIYNSKVKWQTQDGNTEALSSLEGSPAVVAMVFTSCQATCPLTMADLKAIEKGISEKAKKETHFAVFSFDSETDTPAVLKAFANKQKVDLAKWTFFHGDKSAVRELAAMLGIQYKKIGKAMYDHSNIISVLDSKGVVVHRQVGVGQSPKDAITSINQMVEKN